MDIKTTKNIKILISVIIFIGAIGTAYSLSLPKWEEINGVDGQIKQMEALTNAKKNYYATIDTEIEALNNAGWAEKKNSIMINFDSSLFFTPKINNFFRTIVSSSGMTLEGMTNSLPEGGSSQVTTTSENGTKTSRGAETTQTLTQQNSNNLSQTQGSTKKTTVNLNVTGTYNNFKNLLSLFAGQTRIVTIKSISVSSSNQEELKGRVKVNNHSFSLVLDVYSY